MLLRNPRSFLCHVSSIMLSKYLESMMLLAFCSPWNNISLSSSCLFHLTICPSVSFNVSGMNEGFGFICAYLSAEERESQKDYDWPKLPWCMSGIKWLISYLSQQNRLEKDHVHINYCHLAAVFPRNIVLFNFFSCHFFPSL